MTIREKDIFLFVNDPGSLDDQVLKYIAANFETYKEAIEFYRNIDIVTAARDENEWDHQLIDELPFETVTLLPVEYKDQSAAASGAAVNFKDENNYYFANVKRTETRAELDLYNNKKQIIQEFKVIIYPGHVVISCKDNRSAIELETAMEIRRIEILFDN